MSYADLLDAIWKNRRGGRAYSRQYMEAVFAANADEERIARARGISAPIITGARFYVAEDNHQKYYLRHDSTLMTELEGYTPAQLRESRVAARLNGYVAGSGTPAQLREDVPRLGVSAAAVAHLEKLVAHRSRMTCA